MEGDAPMAFTADQVSRLTGLSPGRLSYWDKLGFFAPEHFDDAGRFGRIYSFRDVVGLRTIGQLRETVSLQHLRELGAWLHEHLTEQEAPWASLKFYVMGKQVLFVDPRTDKVTSSKPPGQLVFEVAIAVIARDLRMEVERLRTRQPSDFGRVTRNRNVLHNRPILAGTRIPTSAIWDFHEAGFTVPAILHEYPDLTERDVTEAIEYERVRREKQAAS